MKFLIQKKSPKSNDFGDFLICGFFQNYLKIILLKI